MPEQHDGGGLSATESADVKSFTPDQWRVIQAFGFDPQTVNVKVVDMLVASENKDDLDARIAHGTNYAPNPEPAWEEGPHLTGENARLKREQLERLGIGHDHPKLTADMRKLLKKG